MPGVIDPTKMYLFFNAMGEWRTVTLTPQTSAGAGTPVPCTKAIRGKVGFRTLQSFSASVVKPECSYSIPYALAPGPWKPGDTLTDANQPDGTAQASPGVTYTILSAEQDEGFWMLYCINPKISYGFKDTGKIQVATDNLTGIGTNARTFADTAYTNIACRIQPTESAWSMQHGRVGDKKVFDVYIAADYDLNPSKHIWVWTSGGNTYEADILAIRNRQNIADLMVLTVELRPGATGTI